MGRILIISMTVLLFYSSGAEAVEVAPRITDREIIESLAGIRGDIKRLEEGQIQLRADIKRLEEEQKQMRADIKRLEEGQIQIRADIRKSEEGQKQLREDMNKQFDRIVNLMVGMLVTFAALVGVTISLAVWDRRTTIKPLESKIKALEETKINRVIEALKEVAKKDVELAEVLRRFNLL